MEFTEDSSYEGATPGPLLLRLAWHSAGTFCGQTKTGGSGSPNFSNISLERLEKEGKSMKHRAEKANLNESKDISPVFEG